MAKDIRITYPKGFQPSKESTARRIHEHGLDALGWFDRVDDDELAFIKHHAGSLQNAVMQFQEKGYIK